MNEAVVELSGAEAPVEARRGFADVLRVGRWAFPLGVLALGLAYAVLKNGGRGAFDTNAALVVIGAAAVAYWLNARSDDRAPALDPLLASLVVLVPGYILFQLIPLPAFLLDALSPARARLVDLVNAVADSRSAPLSVNPAATLAQLLVALGCVITFLLVRDLAWKSRERFLQLAVFEAEPQSPRYSSRNSPSPPSNGWAPFLSSSKLPSPSATAGTRTRSESADLASKTNLLR